ncbi:hypothetical protein [Falsiroseomonas selenitidurans]|uniref:Uncharacterized protein n=1 Tax=Falsiroseomonas selenitidurans TaxID=2716335 RepID=A0ABX1EHL8_9PROT|nr:hypothetical protein [Falsiroseomonas selenitidurans]NKC34360.1 hypothetical protein [Falsiroseomonas selenitidurans]
MAILLILLPLLAWLLWRWLRPDGARPSPALLVALAVTLVLVAAAGLWLRQTRTGQAGADYVPPSLGADGRVIPSHLEPAR